MTKQEEIDILQSLKGDTYFAQFFGSKDIDQMCQNINNDFAIEGGCGFSQKAEALERINADLKKEFQQKIHDLGMELIKVLDKGFDEDAIYQLVEGKVGLVCLPCTPRWCHTLIEGVKPIIRLDQLTARLDSNGKPHIQYGNSVDHYFRKIDYVQLFCRNGSEIRALFKKCVGFSIETTQTKKDGFIEFKPKNFVVHLK